MFLFKQKTAYEMRISDWISDVCSSDLDRTMHRIDDEDFPEIGGQVLIFAQPVDHVADRDMLWHRDELALHQATGALFGEGEGVLDRGAILGLHRLEDGLLLVRLHILDDRHRVVGVRSEEHTSELQSLMRISYAVFCLKKTKN